MVGLVMMFSMVVLVSMVVGGGVMVFMLGLVTVFSLGELVLVNFF